MGRIDGALSTIKKIWGPFLLFCLSVAIILDIICQVVDFSDPGASDYYTIWNGNCKDNNATNEIDDCLLLNSSFVLAIVFGIIFTVFAGLYFFGYKGISKMAQNIFGGITLFSGIIFVIFQILATAMVRNQLTGRSTTRKDVFGWELLVTATIISCFAIVLNPVTFNYIMHFSKNFYEMFQEAGKKRNSYHPIVNDGKVRLSQKDFKPFQI